MKSEEEPIEAEETAEYQLFTPRDIANKFTESTHRLAPAYGFAVTQDPPEMDVLLMAVMRDLIDQGVIVPGQAHVLPKNRE